MQFSVIASDLIRLILLFFTCRSDLPSRLRDECVIVRSSAQATNSLLTDEAPCSSEEKQWPNDGECYEVMTQGPCKENQLFFPDADDAHLGFCDCRNDFKNASLLLYSEMADECYLQNTQGPCNDGEWFVLESKSNPIPQCQTVPEGCLADGQHAYWEPGENEDYYDGPIEKKCWRLGTQGPCPAGEIFQRFITSEAGCQIIGSKTYLKPPSFFVDEDYVDPRAIGMAAYRTCGPGSKRAQNGKCRTAF